MVIAVVIFLFYFYRLDKWLTLDSLQQHYGALNQWTNDHYLVVLGIYLITFIFLIACTIPVATLYCLMGGLLFGAPAIIYAEIGTLGGGLLLFHAVRTSFGADFAKSRARGWIHAIRKGIQENAFHYILLLRLMPVFPCWISNIGSGLLNVSQRTFLIASAIGILPSTAIYVMVGRSMRVILQNNEPLTRDLIFRPGVILPLVALGCFSLIPIIYKHFKRGQVSQ